MKRYYIYDNRKKAYLLYGYCPNDQNMFFSAPFFAHPVNFIGDDIIFRIDIGTDRTEWEFYESEQSKE
jgi:hypothetical protein